jgi:NUMOD4 motif
MPEDWKPIPGYEGLYEVSTQGRINSSHRSEFGDVIRPKLAPGSQRNAGRVVRRRYLLVDLSCTEYTESTRWG